MPLSVELITPEKLLAKESFDFVAAPTPLGQIGILPRHAPLLTRLVPGELRLKRGDDVQSVAVTGGFLEVQEGSRVEIFAETAEFSDQIDAERARIAAERAKAKLAGPQADLTAEELAQLESALTRAVLRLKLAGVQRRRYNAPNPAAHDELPGNN